MLRILIADDHAVVRTGYRHILSALGLHAELAEAATGSELIARLRDASWDLLLLDLALPDRGGLSLLREIRSVHPELSVLVVSGLPEEQFALEALRAGGHGFLSKQAAAEDLLEAIRCVLSGERYASQAVQEQLSLGVGKHDIAPHQLLSARERVVFDRLAAGATVKAIAQTLQLSVKTVSTYRTRILEKMRLNSNADMTAYVLRHSVVDQEHDGAHSMVERSKKR